MPVKCRLDLLGCAARIWPALRARWVGGAERHSGSANAIDGETVWRPIKSAKAVAKEATLDARRETTFLVIKEAGAAGIILTAIQRVPFEASVLAQCLDRLLALGRVRIQQESSRTRRYFATEDGLVVAQT
jgi:hypothetical protein